MITTHLVIILDTNEAGAMTALIVYFGSENIAGWASESLTESVLCAALVEVRRRAINTVAHDVCSTTSLGEAERT
jgi:hypothetical protein